MRRRLVTTPASTRVGEASAGLAAGAAMLPVVLTLGLLAFAPTGAQAALLGIQAAFAGVLVGGAVMIAASRGPIPTAGPSSATALILASLIVHLASDPSFEPALPAGRALLIATTGATVAVSGVLQLLLAGLGLGSLANYVPKPVLAGFMNGIALLILISQLPVLTGLSATAIAGGGIAALGGFEGARLAAGAVTAAVIWRVAQRYPKLPATLVGLARAAFWSLQSRRFGHRSRSARGWRVPQQWMRPDTLLPLAGSASGVLIARHGFSILVTALLLATIGSLETILNNRAVDQAAAQIDEREP